MPPPTTSIRPPPRPFDASSFTVPSSTSNLNVPSSSLRAPTSPNLRPSSSSDRPLAVSHLASPPRSSAATATIGDTSYLSPAGQATLRARSRSSSPLGIVDTKIRYVNAGGAPATTPSYSNSNSNMNKTRFTTSPSRPSTATTSTPSHDPVRISLRSPARNDQRSTIPSPTRSEGNNSSSAQPGNTSTNTSRASAPVSSLLDSMSELRALIAKKELELSSLAARPTPAMAAFHQPTPLTTPSSFNTSTAYAPNSTSYRSASPIMSAFAAQPSPLPHIDASFASSNAMLNHTTPASSSVPSFSLTHAHPHVSTPASSSTASQFNSHLQTLHDRELHEYAVRIASLEQLMYDREEVNQAMKLEVERLKKREETLLQEADQRNAAHKKQLDTLNSHLETLTWNRHESLEKQRDDFERLRKEMMDSLVQQEQRQNTKLQGLNTNLLNYEEQLRVKQREIDELKAQSKKNEDTAATTITTLQLEITALQQSKQNTKEQLSAGVKSQLNMSSNLKATQRQLEETLKKLEVERDEHAMTKRRYEEEQTRMRKESEMKDEEVLQNLRAVENQLMESERRHQAQLTEAQRERDDLIDAHRRECEKIHDEAHQVQRHLTEEFSAKSATASLDLIATHNRVTHLERDLQEQRQQMQHDAQMAQEALKLQLEEKERDIQSLNREYQAAQRQAETFREKNSDLETMLNEYKLELVQLQTEMVHMKSSLDDTQARLADQRVHHTKVEEERQAEYQARADEMQSRLLKLEAEFDECQRALQMERLRSNDLSTQLQLLRTSSQNKVRAIEVARSLEQQALLTDFASQLNRVRTEITAIKKQTPKELQREWNREKREREKERRDEQTEERSERSRERSRTRDSSRLNSPSLRPLSAGAPPSPRLTPTAPTPLPLISPPRRHVRVRSIDDTPLATSGVRIAAQA